jgi:pentatricopeptide repeat protein
MAAGLYLFFRQGDVSHTDIYFKQPEAIMRKVPLPYMATRMHAYALQDNTEQVISLFHHQARGLSRGGRLDLYYIPIKNLATRCDLSAVSSILDEMCAAGVKPNFTGV